MKKQSLKDQTEEEFGREHGAVLAGKRAHVNQIGIVACRLA